MMANSNRAASTRSAPTSIRGRCSDDAARPESSRLVRPLFCSHSAGTIKHLVSVRTTAERLRGTADSEEAGRRLRRPGVRLAELLGRLSLAFDIANDAPYGKGVRSVVLAVELGRRAGATDGELHDTFWLSLLGYLGCGGLQGRTDSAPGRSRRRPRATSRSGWRRSSARDPMSAPRCTHLYVAGETAGQASPPTTMQALPTAPGAARRMSWETAHQQHGRAGAAALIRRNAGSELDPRLAAVFVAEQPALLTAIDDSRIFDRFLEIEPGPPPAPTSIASTTSRARWRSSPISGVPCSSDIRPVWRRSPNARPGRWVSAPTTRDRSEGRRFFMTSDGSACRTASGPARGGSTGARWSGSDCTLTTQSACSPPSASSGPVAEIAASAHEHVDGSGYPQRRTGTIVAARGAHPRRGRHRHRDE